MRHALCRAAVAAILAVGLGGCGSVIPLTWFVTEVELHRSSTQRLVVANEYGQAVALEATDGGPALTIAQKGQAELPFVVISVAEVEDSAETPWLRLAPTGQFDYLIQPAPPKLLRAAGADVELRVRLPDGNLRPVPLSLQGCLPAWSDRPAPPRVHPISIGASLPLPGIPLRLCPP